MEPEENLKKKKEKRKSDVRKLIVIHTQDNLQLCPQQLHPPIL